MGSAQYFSSRSTKWTGDWNEGFIFVVTYHAQLFDTIDVCLNGMSWFHINMLYYPLV